MEDRLASSLRAARDRTSQDLAARQSVGALPPQTAAPLDSRTGRLLEWPRAVWPFAGSNHHQSRISVAGTIALSLVMSAGFFALQKVSSTSRETAHSNLAAMAHDRHPGLTLARMQEDDEPASSEEQISRRPSRVSSPGNVTQPSAEPFAEATTQKTSRFKIDAAAGHKIDGDQFNDDDQRAGTSFEDDRISQHGDHATRPPQQPADDFQSVPPAPADQSAQENFDRKLQLGRTNKVYRLFDNRSGAVPAHLEQQASRSAALSSAMLETERRRNVKTADWNFPPPSAPSNSPADGAEVSSLEDSQNGHDNSGPMIVPGKLSPADEVAISIRRRSTEGIQQARSEVKPDRSAEARNRLLAAQQANGVSGLFQERSEAAANAGSSVPPAPNPLVALDQKKVMSFQFRNAPWCVVLAEFASATGLELRMQAFPQGVFNRWDTARYTPSQTLHILDDELVQAGCQLKLVGNALCVVPAAADRRSAEQGQANPPSTAASVPTQRGTRVQ